MNRDTNILMIAQAHESAEAANAAMPVKTPAVASKPAGPAINQIVGE
jgi:hypothetical protein